MTGAREYADRAAVSFGYDACVFEGGDRDFQQYTLLRIHQLGEDGRLSEERRIEPVGILEDAARGHVARIRRVDARVEVLFENFTVSCRRKRSPRARPASLLLGSGMPCR